MKEISVNPSKGSEVAEMRRQIEQEDAATCLGFTGPAITSQHAFITARMERGAQRILHLLEQGEQAQAQALMDLPEDW